MSASKEQDDDTEHLGAQVPASMKRKARVTAAKEDLSMSEWLRHVVDEAVED